VVSTCMVTGGSAGGPSLIEVQAAVDEADERVGAATRQAEQVTGALETAVQRRDELTGEVDHALERLHESDARAAAVAEQRGQFGSTARAAAAEADRLRKGQTAKEGPLGAERTALAELEERLATAAEQAPEEREPSTDERDRLAAEATAARSAEM